MENWVTGNCLLRPPPPLCCCQVVVTGDRVHTIPVEPPKAPQPSGPPSSSRPAAPPGITLANFIPVSEDNVDGSGAGGFTIHNPVGEGHALRPYWEYLSFLFRCEQCERCTGRTSAGCRL